MPLRLCRLCLKQPCFNFYVNQVDVVNTVNVLFQEEELSLTELPEISEKFQQEVAEIGGYNGTQPNLRVVSGLDPDLTDYYGGEYHLKYLLRSETETLEYYVLHKHGGGKRILTVIEAKAVSPKLGLVLPVVEKKVEEYGIPRYFVEILKPPSAFGTPEAWEANRYLAAEDNPATGQKVDLLGEFPENGLYETWFMIEEPVFNSDNEVESTTFGELNDSVLEFIKFKVNEAKETSLAQQHNQQIEKTQQNKKKLMQDFRETVKDSIKDRIDRIVQTPKVFVPNSYGTSN